MDGYNEKSCNALEKPFYRPVEAAIRWCGLIAHEAQILMQLEEDGIPKTGQFPHWPCLQANTEKILDAIMHSNISHGRDGKTVALGDHVARARLTVRHTDLREWMTKHYPDQKPAFLFDEIERNAHAAINADSFRALQADRDAARAEIEKAKAWGAKIISERDSLLGERNSLRAMVDSKGTTGERSETTYLNIIGGLLELMLGKSPAPVDIPLRAIFTVSGVRKSAEFTTGVESALGVLGAAEGAADNLQSNIRTRDVAFLGLHELILKGGAFAEGAIAAFNSFVYWIDNSNRNWTMHLMDWMTHKEDH